jgi:hypothetical protein
MSTKTVIIPQCQCTHTQHPVTLLESGYPAPRLHRYTRKYNLLSSVTINLKWKSTIKLTPKNGGVLQWNRYCSFCKLPVAWVERNDVILENNLGSNVLGQLKKSATHTSMINFPGLGGGISASLILIASPLELINAVWLLILVTFQRSSYCKSAGCL